MRLWEHVTKTPTCWLWTGTKLPRGYGHIWDCERQHTIYTHRAAWELVAGPIPPGLDVLHTCDVPACVRNDDIGTYEVRGRIVERRGHLFLGTGVDNSRDMADKGRNAPQRAALARLERRGESNAMAKLTEADVRAILAGRLTHPEPLNVLAARYHVTMAAIDLVLKRKTWGWLDA